VGVVAAGGGTNIDGGLPCTVIIVLRGCCVIYWHFDTGVSRQDVFVKLRRMLPSRRGAHARRGDAAHGARRRSRGQHARGAGGAQQRVAARHQRRSARRIHANGAAAVVAIIVLIATADRCAGVKKRRLRQRRRLVVHAHPGKELCKKGV
jgi:hypothetical protein